MAPPLEPAAQRPRDTCPVCSGGPLQIVLRRDNVPVYANKLYASAAAAQGVTRDILEMAHCGRCDVLFNRYFDFGKLDYSEDYESGAVQSPAYREHLRDMALRVSPELAQGATVAELGCGKGDFLRILLELAPAAFGLGIDESYEGPLQLMDGRLRFERRQFGPGPETIDADAVVLRLMLEHVADPRAFLHNVSAALPIVRRRILLERARSEWVIECAAFLDLYYERYTLFSEATVAWLAEDCGLALLDEAVVFGGQYALDSIGLSRDGARGPVASVASQVDAFAAAAVDYAAQWSGAVSSRAGTFVLWGAGARGATFLQLADPDARLVSCVVDLSPRKQGKYVAGTGHAILSPEAAATFKPETVLVTNPAFVKEVQARSHYEFPGATVVLVGDPDETSRCLGQRPMPS